MALSDYLRPMSVAFRAARSAFLRAPVRFRLLLTILALVSLAGAVWKLSTLHLEKQLFGIAEEIVMKFNAESPLPDTEGAGTDTTCEVFCSYKYVLFGPATGKIVFMITPKCHDEHTTDLELLACLICSGRATYELDYYYVRDGGSWVFSESAMCHPASEHR